MNNLVFTVEQLKAMVDDTNNSGFIAHMRALPIDCKNSFNMINNHISIEGSTIKGLPNDNKVANIILSILTKWFNRELSIRTNVLEIDNLKEDLNDLLTLEDGLLVTENKKIVKKLNSMSSIKELPEFKGKNNDYIIFAEPFKATFIDEVIKIPNEMLITPMDITRSRLFAILNDYDIAVDENKLNIVIDYNNNSFIIDKNMHGRTVMKVLTNRDIIVNQVTGL